jgi:hypothetical protein
MIGLRRSTSGSVLVLDGYAEGYLVKQGGRIKTWHKRFFVFQDGFLSYRKDSRDAAKVLRRDAVVNVHFYSKVRNGLCVQLQCGRKLCMSAKTEDQMHTWYDVLSEHLNKRNKAREFQQLYRRQQELLAPIEEIQNSFLEANDGELPEEIEDSALLSDTDSDTDSWVYDF